MAFTQELSGIEDIFKGAGSFLTSTLLPLYTQYAQLQQLKATAEVQKMVAAAQQRPPLTPSQGGAVKAVSSEIPWGIIGLAGIAVLLVAYSLSGRRR